MEFPAALSASDLSVWLKEAQLASLEVKEIRGVWVIAESRGWVEDAYESINIVGVYRLTETGEYRLDRRRVRRMSRLIFERLGRSGYLDLDYL